MYVRCRQAWNQYGHCQFLGVQMSWGVFSGRAQEGHHSTLQRGEFFLKQGLKQDLLVHIVKIVKDGGRHCI